MTTITYDAEYFNCKDALECGQIFRFRPYKNGYLVFSKGEACYVYTDGNKTFIECENADYFYNFFDLSRDYAVINKRAKEYGFPALTKAAELSKGVRLFNQDGEEMIFSFIVSQNNNIPRIQKIIESICSKLGEKRTFFGEEYYSFPSASALAEKDAAFYRALGAGYRDVFLAETAKRIKKEGTDKLRNLCGADLKKELLTYKGIGDKVADCIALFGFKKTDSFPVDTWVEKIYREDFGGTLTDRKKISAYFCNLFGENSGYVQQYLFYAKRANLY